MHGWAIWEGEGGFRGREKILVLEIQIKQRWDFIQFVGFLKLNYLGGGYWVKMGLILIIVYSG